MLESPSLDPKVGESAWYGCGWGQAEPLKIVETLHGLSLQTQLTGRVWVGSGEVPSRRICAGARQGMGFKCGLDKSLTSGLPC